MEHLMSAKCPNAAAAIAAETGIPREVHRCVQQSMVDIAALHSAYADKPDMPTKMKYAALNEI